MQSDATKRENPRFLRGFSRFSLVAPSAVRRRFRCNLVQSVTRPDPRGPARPDKTPWGRS